MACAFWNGGCAGDENHDVVGSANSDDVDCAACGRAEDVEEGPLKEVGRKRSLPERGHLLFGLVSWLGKMSKGGTITAGDPSCFSLRFSIDA